MTKILLDFSPNDYYRLRNLTSTIYHHSKYRIIEPIDTRVPRGDCYPDFSSDIMYNHGITSNDMALA